MSQRIVINRRVGIINELGLSHKAFLRLRELGQKEALREPDWGEAWPGGKVRSKWDWEERGSFGYNIPRDDPLLVQVVQELGEEANGDGAELEIVEVPDDVDWVVLEVGREWVAERHRVWPQV